ncbi:MAG TPA: tryptophan 2,3-dioxygenase family protein [Xanthobacteraceae bacterium]|nr:tryptophan 2,3-dioxygenase family protein [Xanthobacteraceae bacterium]
MSAAHVMYYADYLKLDRLLSAQDPESARRGRLAHDEMLFIVVHQAYELWFKQILHELDRIQSDFGGEVLEDELLGRIVHGLDRINEILKLLIQQLEVLETMTPLDFLDFRDFLFPASGFQSVQFRLIEIRLGLSRNARLDYAGKPFDTHLREADKARVAAADAGPKLIDQLDRWLSRTPFVHRPDYDFSIEYRKAVKEMLEDDARRVRANPALGVEQREAEARRIEASLAEFRAIFEPTGGPSPWTMSRAAVQAALFIIVYRDRPVLQLPFRLLAALMNLEELMTLWRYRHALMVERMIGVKVGTGGSSGHAYLRDTAARHHIFSDLFRLSTYLIPRSRLPKLPRELEDAMGFTYTMHTLQSRP